jgi:hypothetical protein
LRQKLDMLMPIHESGSSAEILAKTVELARNFLADLGVGQLVSPRSLNHVAYFRQASPGRKTRHVAKRAAKREVKMQPDVGLGRELAQLMRTLWPKWPRCQHACRAQPAGAKRFHNTATHARRQRIIVGTEAERKIPSGPAHNV